MEAFFQWLIDRFQSLYCTFIVRPYERAVHMRTGKILRVVGPGYYFKLPFELDELHKIDMRQRSTNLSTQVVTTQDGASLVVGVIAKWKVKPDGVQSVVMEMSEFAELLDDVIYGMVADCMSEWDWEEADLEVARDKISEAIRRRVGRMGIDIDDVYITDIGETRTFRLVQGE